MPGRPDSPVASVSWFRESATAASDIRRWICRSGGFDQHRVSARPGEKGPKIATVARSLIRPCLGYFLVQHPDVMNNHGQCRRLELHKSAGSLVQQKPVECELVIVRGVMDICPRCGFTAPTTKPERPRIEPPSGSPPVEAATEHDKPIVEPSTSAAANVVELPRKHPPGIQDAPGARMAPSATHQVAPYVDGYAPFGPAVLGDPNPFSVHASHGYPLPKSGGDR